MGTPEAGKLFLQALTGSGLGHDPKEDSMFDTVALQTITDIRAYEGRLTCLIPVEPRVQNRYGTLHGGCIGQHTCTITVVQRRLRKHMSGCRSTDIQWHTLRTV